MTVAERVRRSALSGRPGRVGRGDRSRWCYVSGLVAARLGRLLDRSALLEMLELKDREELLVRLRQTTLGAELEPGQGWLRTGARLDRRFREEVARLGRDCPDGTVTDFFGLQEECRLLKRYLKERLEARREGEPGARGAGAREAGGGLETEASSWGEEEEAPGRGLWAEALARVERVLEETGPGEEEVPAAWLVDLILDGALLEAESALAEEMVRRWDAPGVAEVIRGWAQFQCLLVAARAQRWPRRLLLVRRHFGMPLGEADWLEPLLEPEVEPVVARARWRAALEAVLGGALSAEEGEPRAPAEEGGAEEVQRVAARGDEVLMGWVRRFRWVAFGPEPVFGHLWALRAEADNLKMVLGALEAGVSPSLIRQRLRPTYV